VSLLLSGGINEDNRDDLLPDEENGSLGIFDKILNLIHRRNLRGATSCRFS
jgi:hypothetical protein